MTIFKLPDLGEGLPDAEITAWHVKEGDHVAVDQSLVSMETAKAVVEVPSPFAGRIKKLYGNKGDVIQTGNPLVEYEREETAKDHENFPQQNTSHENIKHENTSRDNTAGATVAGKLEVGTTILTEHPMGLSRKSTATTIKATPAIRALAQRLNVNLANVTATGPAGTLTTMDVERAAHSSNTSHSSHAVPNAPSSSPKTSLSNSSKRSFATLLPQGQTEGQLEPLRGVRRTMAQAMMQSHAEVVPVTVMDDAKLFAWKINSSSTQKTDQITNDATIQKTNLQYDITVRLIQAICAGLKAEPALNAWFEGESLGRQLVKHVNLGLAVDTADGLFVPVIHEAETLDAAAIRQKVDVLKKQVSERTIRPEELRGVSFTLSNFGKFAGRYANPIIVPPTVAILGVGSLREEVVAVNHQPTVCPVLPLALTFDHRAVTGGEATRFLGAVIESLEKG